jgi:CRISPR/Cas system-associated endonuclease Cas1
MAAGKTVSQLLQSHNSLTPRHGIVTLFGYGIQARVDRGHLLLEDGIGADRRQARFPRVRNGLTRVVCISEDGFFTLGALKWLSEVGIPLTLLDRLGKIRFLTGPTASADARLHRAQFAALDNGVGLEISRTLIDAKIEGQERVARETLKDSITAEAIAKFRAKLGTAENIEMIRNVEAQSAVAYFGAWRNVAVMWPKADLHNIPAHWQTAGTRQSPLSGGPRLAVTPVHAILNYCSALLESETRLALSVCGLCPNLDFGLHTDTPHRDSLALTVLEPVRPHLENWLLSWIMQEPLRRSDFLETATGNCRLMAHLCDRLSETAPTWGKLVAPWAEWVAQTLWDSIRKPARKNYISPTRLTQRRRSEGRGNEFVLNAAPAPHPERICRRCGVRTQRGRHCPKCGREISREKLIDLAKLGRAAAQSPESRQKHSETQRQHEAAKRAWRSSPRPAWPDEKTYVQEIQPRLATVTISALASALGVSEPYAAYIRAGRNRPHPRHWQALAQLFGCQSRE